MSSSTSHRKLGSLAIKRNDAETLTRVDIQYDLLYHIFSNPQAVFSDSNPTLLGDPPGTKVTFHDLYCNAIIRSPRASKVLREKMLEDPQFCNGKAIFHFTCPQNLSRISDVCKDVGMISLLTNVGRINTTMACK
jgi:Ino eighty subunit 1